MSESESGEKKVGVFGALIAAIGMIFAKGADDCARVGAKGAQFADDGARFASRGAQLSDDALRGGGKLGGFADDAVRGAQHGSLPGLSDEALAAAARSEKAAAGLSDDVLEQGMDLSLEVVSNLEFDLSGGQYDESETGLPSAASMPSASPRAAAPESGLQKAFAKRELKNPKALALVPTNEDAFASMFGYAAPKGVLRSMNLVADLLGQPMDSAIGEQNFAKMVASNRTSNPLVILGYTALDASNQLVFPNGQSIADKEIHEACVNVGINCIVIACDSKEITEGESCIRSAYILWSNRAKETGKLKKSQKTLEDFSAQLLHDRKTARHGSAMIISRILFESSQKPKLIRSRLKRPLQNP